jgi:hypothetical protein
MQRVIQDPIPFLFVLILLAVMAVAVVRGSLMETARLPLGLMILRLHLEAGGEDVPAFGKQPPKVVAVSLDGDFQAT